MGVNRTKRLTQAEIKGIKLVADVFVAKEIVEHLKKEYPTLNGLPGHLRKHVPKFESTEQELAKQISLTRKHWLELILIKEEW